MSLKDWHKFGWLKPHKTSFQELSNLLAIADRDIVSNLKSRYSNLDIPTEDPPE